MLQNKVWLAVFSTLFTLEYTAFAIIPSQVSVKDLTIQADAGNHESQYILGTLYEEGIEVKRNTSLALKWYLKAGEKGNKDAQLRLGEAYHNGGWGDAQQNFEESKRWYKKAADQNSALGQYNLASMLASNQVTEDSLKEARTLLQKAAEQDFYPAQINLALLLTSDHAGDKNSLFLAKYWLKKAADQGSRTGHQLLEKLGKKNPKLPIGCPFVPKFKICPILGRYQNMI